jgi:hypothetical protein
MTIYATVRTHARRPHLLLLTSASLFSLARPQIITRALFVAILREVKARVRHLFPIDVVVAGVQITFIKVTPKTCRLTWWLGGSQQLSKPIVRPKPIPATFPHKNQGLTRP